MNPLEKKVQDYLSTPITEGGRNLELFKASALLKDLGHSIPETIQILEGKALSDGLKGSEIKNTIQSAHNRPIDYIPKSEPRLEDHKSGFLSWDDDIGGLATPPKKRVEAYRAEIPAPMSDWEMDFQRLLNNAFEPKELVAFNYTPRDLNGKLIPGGAGVLGIDRDTLLETPIEEIVKHTDGAWIRINPMDGKTAGDKSVTSFRHALVESDTLPIETQLSIYKELQLPVSAIIHSGGKSLHAWVRVEAENADQYKKRVKYLYELMESNGFEIDHSNKNPSRLSRLTGVLRGENPQYLIAERSGMENWASWVNWLETKNNQLPEIESFDELELENPPLAEELIKGVLRKGHKMLLSGDSKSGKSFLQINLALCLNSGHPWLEMEVKKCNVLYVNFEIDRASFMHRVKKVKEDLGIESTSNLDVWNLRGRSAGIEELAPQIIHKIKTKNYGAVILDPIYKVLGERDENSAGDIISFFNYLDQIAVQSGCSIIVAHHFSKGQQGQKTSHDRMSGSGVFGRDPDALVTLSTLKDEELAFRLEGTLREFPAMAPKNVRFEYPLHRVDDSLDGATIDGEQKAKLTNSEIMNMYFNLLTPGADGVYLQDLAESMDISKGGLRSRLSSWTTPEDGYNLTNNRGLITHEKAKV
jgi:RecA-family ATPase